MNIPERYLEWLASKPNLETRYGCAGFHFFRPEELSRAQQGYSVNSETELVRRDRTDQWNQNWLVIGIETGLGDPIFIDIAEREPAVLTANHGEGSWKPQRIATSLQKLSAILDEYEAMAQYRSGCDGLEEDDPECSAFIERIKRLDSGPIHLDFWLSMLAY